MDRAREGVPIRSLIHVLQHAACLLSMPGGVKLFVGRLPREVNKTQLEECFHEFGEVLEVFIIASQAASGVGCAFVRMAQIDAAEEAISELHEQRVLIPEQADLGPMQVAFAKGEAIRLGLDEKEEILPSFKEARQKVVEHHEKKQFFEKMQKQQEEQAKACRERAASPSERRHRLLLIVEYQHALMMQHQEKPREAMAGDVCNLRSFGWGHETQELVTIVKAAVVELLRCWVVRLPRLRPESPWQGGAGALRLRCKHRVRSRAVVQVSLPEAPGAAREAQGNAGARPPPGPPHGAPPAPPLGPGSEESEAFSGLSV
ncbi:FCA [Symbiodinium natans]|uniref:FCA protein n=1 Tax=Symbiodinium natans TaxID=878477 RepID=A0A812MJB7_9DINO|nr:FCA [Symbiodinium natans]